MAAASPDPGKDVSAAQTARATLAGCDAKLATHRTALEAMADSAVVSQWIAET